MNITPTITDNATENNLKREMRHVLSANQTDTLNGTADDQEPAEENDNSDRRQNWIDQREKSAENHQSTLYKVPKRMPLNRFSHRLTHGLGGSFEGHGHESSPSAEPKFPR
jgi:hypothetical protein